MNPFFVGLIALAIVAEGANYLSDGNFLLASMQKIAQTEGGQSSQTTLSPTSADSAAQPSPPPAGQMLQSQPAAPQSIQGHPAGEKGSPFYEEEDRDEFIDPREVKQSLKEIKELQKQIRQLSKQANKIPGGAEEMAKLGQWSVELNQFQGVISNPSAGNSVVREAMRDFRDNQYWELLNKVRAKVELPRELKQINTSIKRVEKILGNKSVQNIGLNIEGAKARVNEMKQNVEMAQAHYNNGNFEEAMETMQFFHEGGHPGEMEGTIYRVKDIKNMLKRLKDETIRAEVNKLLQEVIDSFNEGNYRDARETMDEYADDLMRLIEYFLRSKSRRGPDQNSFSRIQNLKQLIIGKLQEKENGRQSQPESQPQSPQPFQVIPTPAP